ncbi:MAG TPA: retropepsin-like aspartic protease [Myxococcales bacterium]|nr:retropepsin-like aspartic protease [Myxococcales bacterium]
MPFPASALALLLALPPVVPASPALDALARGDLDGALAARAANAAEARYVRARVHVARGELGAAELETATLGGTLGAQAAFYLAHARGQPREIARSAAKLCAAGDPTGRACADAELYDGATRPTEVTLAAPTEVPLATRAPFPLLLARAGGVKTGFVLDSGASDSVISTALAKQLGLHVTRAAFPVGVAAGGARSEAHLALLPELTVGSLTVRRLPVLVLDMADLDRAGVSGLLSPQALPGVTLAIDLGRHVLSVSPGSATPAPSPDAVTLPYVSAGLDLAVTASAAGGPRALFGLDTGMEGGLALSATYARAGDVPRPASVVEGAGGAASLESVPPVPVNLGPLTLRPRGPCVVSPMAKADVGLAGLLGDGLFEGGVVVLDNARRQVTVVIPNADERERPAPDGRPGAFDL